MFWANFLALDGPYFTLLWPTWPPVVTPLIRRNPVSTWSKLIFDPQRMGNLGKIVGAFYLLNHPRIERSMSKLCISQLRQRVKRSSWSNFVALSIGFILMRRSRLPCPTVQLDTNILWIFCHRPYTPPTLRPVTWQAFTVCRVRKDENVHESLQTLKTLIHPSGNRESLNQKVLPVFYLEVEARQPNYHWFNI